MIIRKKDSALEVDSPGVKIFDYALQGVNLGITYQELNGRVPAHGAGMNTVCEECYYIIQGSARVFIDGKEGYAEPGDVVVLPKGTASYLIAENLIMLTLTNPDWYQAQHKEVEI